MGGKNIEARKLQARMLRYKKPMIAGLSLDDIRSQLWDMREACENVEWSIDGEGYDYLCDMLGDEDEAQRFKLEFSDVGTCVERMMSDLEEVWIPEAFDLMQVASGLRDVDGTCLVGYDVYEDDYFGLSGYDMISAQDEATQSLIKRLKKAEIVEQMGVVFRVTLQYVSLKYRYDCLKAVMEIITEDTKATMDAVRSVEKMYSELDGHWGEYGYYKQESAFDQMASKMPGMAWLQ